jgi:serine/threonine-protein kinase
VVRGGAGVQRSPSSNTDPDEERSSLVDGKYRICHRIGEGAMGIVYAAVHELTDREVALKLIARRGLPLPQLRERLLREARACGRIAHRNVLEVLDVGQTSTGDPFLVMPLLRGETLRGKLRRQLRLSEWEAARVLAQAARGVAVAHAAGVIHRDLKPGNIFLHAEADCAAPVVKVLDFGLSKLQSSGELSNTTIGTTLGTVGYMAPEQVRADSGVDHRVDIWTLGIVLYESIAGRRPFADSDPVRFMTEVLTAPIPDLAAVLPGVDVRLAALVQRCLERDPARRISSALEIAVVLDAVAAEAERFDADETIRVPPLTMDHVDNEPPTTLQSPASSVPPAVKSSTPQAQRALPSLRPPAAAPFVTGLVAGAGIALLGTIAVLSPLRDAPPRATMARTFAPLFALAQPIRPVCSSLPAPAAVSAQAASAASQAAPPAAVAPLRSVGGPPALIRVPSSSAPAQPAPVKIPPEHLPVDPG